jgi:hypothetical protein
VQLSAIERLLSSFSFHQWGRKPPSGIEVEKMRGMQRTFHHLQQLKERVMRASIVVLAALALLVACGTTAEQAAYRADPVVAMAQEYGPACDKAGYVRSGPQWRSCIMQESTRDDLERHSLFYDRYMQWYWLR